MCGHLLSQGFARSPVLCVCAVAECGSPRDRRIAASTA
ncbi:hypothetical protein SynA1825c_01388 [Synechococcus sp. A18-25c]|nr:hypothetical protein SynA1825c_01388 [Synechococcus sp. A18-25c]